MENQMLQNSQETPPKKNEENVDVLKKTIEFYENKLLEQEEKFKNDIQTLLNNSKQLNFESMYAKNDEVIEEKDEIEESSENIIKKLNLKRR